MSAHVPVMLDEVMAVLAPRDDAIYVDATFGGGGYTEALLERARCTVYAIDRDEDAIARGRALADRFGGRLTLMHGRFSEMETLLAGHGVSKADGVAFDLGVSSFQFDEAERGFSFSHDGPLDMRMDTSRDESAADLVNTLSQSELASILRDFGEEKRAQAVARAIIAARPITRTGELAAIVERIVGRGGQAIHPATRTFQALRIAVNDELGELERGLDAAECVLSPKGRLAVVCVPLAGRPHRQALPHRTFGTREPRLAPCARASAVPRTDLRGERQTAPYARTRRSPRQPAVALGAAALGGTHHRTFLERSGLVGESVMIRTLNFAFIAITGFVCLGLYRIAEEARVAAVDLRETRSAIVQEQDALAVLGAEWARVTQPARISALTQKHLDLSALPVMEFSSLTQLPQKAPPLAPETNFATVKAIVPDMKPAKPQPHVVEPDEPTFAVVNTGT